MRCTEVLICVCSLFLGVIRAQVGNVPLLSRYPGLVYNNGSDSAKVTLEAFLDLNCGDSAAAYPVLKQVAEHYGPSNLQLRLHQFPLPYHRNALLCAQGLLVIQDQLPSRAFDYMQKIFDNRGSLVDAATVDMSEDKIVDLIADYAVSATGIDKQTFKDSIYLFRGDVAVQWKFGCRRGTAGTPWYFVNGIDLSRNPSDPINFEEWQSILDPLINSFQQHRKPYHASHKVLKSKRFS